MKPTARATGKRKSLPISAITEQVRKNFTTAATLHQQGQLEQAEALCLQILSLQPKHFEAIHLVGIMAYQSNDYERAQEWFLRATRINPKDAYAHNNHGAACRTLKKYEAALESFDLAIILMPDYGQAHLNRCLVLLDLRQHQAALESADKVIALEPSNTEAHLNRGVALQEMGRYQEALGAADTAIALNPQFAKAYNNRGNALGKLQDFCTALTSYDHAIKLDRTFADAFTNRAKVLIDLRDFEAALDSAAQAISLAPSHPEAHFNYGIALEELGQWPKAIASFDKAIAVKPAYADAYYSRGIVLGKLARVEESLLSYERTLEFDPAHAGAMNNIGIHIGTAGDPESATEFFRKALRSDRAADDIHSNLIFHMDLMAGPDTAALQQERRAWNEVHAAPLLRNWTHPNVAQPDRMLRVGYVSGDFKNHSASSSFAWLLQRFDRSNFEVFAYSNSRTTDHITMALKAAVTAWRDIVDLSDDAAADLIRQDGIDILVDLSGHTKGNRLLVFARKPVPVQISAIGYPSGTGMPAMDALISSPVLIPPNERHLYAEEVRYLSTAVGYSRPVSDFPAVNELPALRNGYITFGSFNRLPKITQESLILWAYLLKQLPESRLLLKSGEFDDHQVQEKLMLPFLNAGVAADRVSILGRTSWTEHMRAFNQVDIAIDPVPHGGGITTLESVAMGVPVITMRWPTLAGRASASMLTPLSLSDWIAEGPDHYLEIARQKSQATSALSALRRQLRATFAESVFGNQSAFVSMMENEYRTLWGRWCETRRA